MIGLQKKNCLHLSTEVAIPSVVDVPYVFPVGLTFPVFDLWLVLFQTDGTPGVALATDKRDYLLSKGKRVLGFTNDDSHQERDIGGAWDTVRAASATPEGIFEALVPFLP